MYGQLGGAATYQFLNLPISARSAALGGKIATAGTPDITLVFSNPSLLDTTMHNHANLTYINYIADINYASAVYARHFQGVGTLAFGVQQLGYGHFDRANTAGQIEGRFHCAETNISTAYAYKIDSAFSIGATAKFVASVLEHFWSIGLAVDIGAQFRTRNQLFSAGLVLRNIGFILKPYTHNNRENLPFEIVAGISKRLEHAPFRFVITLHQLQNWNMRYQQPQQSTNLLDNGTNNETTFKKIGNETLSHLILGVEFVPNLPFTIQVGYNYQRRNELKIMQRSAVTGLSAGFGLKIRQLTLNYSIASYHLAGFSHHIALETNFDELFRKF